VNESRRLGPRLRSRDGAAKRPLSDDELSHALHLIERLDSSGRDMSPQLIGLASRIEHIRRARHELGNRRRRMSIFGNAMFGEAGWEVLLLLYGEQSLAPQTIAGIGKGVTSAPTTVLRWLDHLESQKLVSRRDHPTDTRAVLVELTDKAVKFLDLYFSETVDAVT